MSKWQKLESPSWFTETLEHFPYRFRVMESKKELGYNINTDLVNHSFFHAEGTKERAEQYKKDVEAYIQKEEMQEKRIADLEVRISILEEKIRNKR